MFRIITAVVIPQNKMAASATSFVHLQLLFNAVNELFWILSDGIKAFYHREVSAKHRNITEFRFIHVVPILFMVHLVKS